MKHISNSGVRSILSLIRLCSFVALSHTTILRHMDIADVVQQYFRNSAIAVGRMLWATVPLTKKLQ